MRDDRRALRFPIPHSQHRVALAILRHDIDHRFVGDLLDLVMQRFGEFGRRAAIDHQNAVVSDDKRQVVIVPGVLERRRLGRADRRPDAWRDLHRL
jgi:hypothetical protein